MAERAPGQDAPRQDTSCYNCGSKDHFAFACPEPTRSEPAGLEAFRQRQAAKQAGGGSGNSSRNHKSKGPIITRYGPPPPAPGAPVTGYGPWPNAPPTPGQYPGAVPPAQVAPPPSLPTPPAYPPVPPVPVPYPGYPPPNPHVGAYGPGYQVPLPAYSAYGPPGPPPPPIPGPPYASPYAPTGHNHTYPPAQPYQAPPQPYYAGPAPLPTPPAYADPAQPPLGYPTPPYNQSYAQPYAPPPLPQYSASYPQSPPAWNPSPGGNPGQNYQHHRGGRHHNRNKGRHSNQSRSSSQTLPPPAGNNPSRSRSPASATPKSANKTELASEGDTDFQWYLEKAFLELERKPADPVGKPLPVEWNDDPTIPPAFNATCIKSEYFSETDSEVFSQSIRGTGAWEAIKGDPSFQLQRGMVTVRFQGHPYEYFVYDIRRRTDDAAGKWTVVSREPVAVSARSPHQSSKRGREDDDGSHESKRYKAAPHSPLPRQSPPYKAGSQTPKAESSSDTWAPQPGGSTARDRGSDPTDRLFDSLNDYGDGIKQRPGSGPGRSPHEATQRHDSGYQSSHSRDPQPHERPGHPASPPGQRKTPSIAQTPPEPRSRSESQTPATRGEGYSPSRQRKGDGDDSDASSQMSDLEYELLGMDRPAKEARPKKPLVAGRGPMKRRQVRINDAFGRRW